MPTQWRATYADARGLEAVKILSDGGTFYLTVRDVTFAGPDLDRLEPLAELAPGSPFTLALGALCACTLSWRMSLQVTDGHRTQPAMIRGALDLGPPAADGRPGRSVELQLFYPGTELGTTGSHESFEAALADLRSQLAPGITIAGLPAAGGLRAG
jgi:Family of unknown function (DUF6304)